MTGRISKACRRLAPRLAVAAAAVLAPASLAASASAQPTGEFANFGNCPLNNAATVSCIYAQTTAGEFDIGSTSVPITKTITLQGGLEAAVGNVTKMIAATNGQTLSESPQTVPGGLLKIVAPSWLPGFLQEIFNEAVNKGLTGVTATTELVGLPAVSAAHALTKSGTALELPVRVHLENSLLGGGCYVGSSSKPVMVDLTTGTTSPPAPNEPISGSAGEVKVAHDAELILIKNDKLVNNSFAAPEAEGCGGILFSWAIDPAVDAEVGLPSEAGHNTAILEGNQEIAKATAVRASEG